MAEFERETRGPGLVVVDFFAQWCGPCRNIAPVVEALAAQYPDVKFLKVDSDKNQDVAGSLRISALPTFHFYVNGVLKDEMKGANPSTLEAKVKQYKVDVNPFNGPSFKLAAAQTSADRPLDAREARLRQFGALETAKPVSAPVPVAASAPTAPAAPVKSQQEVEEEEALAQAMAMSLAASALAATAHAHGQDAADHQAAMEELAQMDAAEQPEIHKGGADQWDEEMVPVPVDETLLRDLLDMGFSDVRARKGLVHGKNLDGALAWLDEHQEDADIDQPYMVRKADTLPKTPLTAEEKAQRLADMKTKIKQRREDRAKQEKQEEIRREKERRERGQKMDETVEERQRMMRKREAEKIKKEKEDAAKERARLKAEIARDKEIRKAHGGFIPSVLGVEGYNPSAVQYEQPEHASAAGSTAPTSAPAASAASAQAAPTPMASVVRKASAPKSAGPVAEDDSSPEDRVDRAIATISRYRTGGDGGNALKLLVTFVRNLVENPTDPKFQSINAESQAFRTKLAGLVGPLQLLRAVGFEKDELENKLKFQGDAQTPLLRATLAKLVQAEALFRQMNP